DTGRPAPAPEAGAGADGADNRVAESAADDAASPSPSTTDAVSEGESEAVGGTPSAPDAPSTSWAASAPASAA
ncbi:hypothetical protein G3I39_32455, partial [Streptomyces fulvissimus]|nr:hypothetical protein [Streptomyces microflavus]